jgi:FAD/FMN-containing dehydrogenase
MLKAMTYPEIYPPEEGGEYHPVAASRTMFVDTIDRSIAEMILDRLQSSSASMAVAQLRVLGGAMERVPADATAFAHRNSKIMVNIAALYEKPEEKATHEAWVADFASALMQSDKGAYVNFLSEEGEERIRAAYPDSTWDRLAAVKARYDPTNLFHLNQNVQPAGE